jgi:hypothetical protein
MKNLLKKKDILSVPKLITAIKKLWTMELSTDYLKKLRNSMPGSSRWSLIPMGHDKVLKKLLAFVFS